MKKRILTVCVSLLLICAMAGNLAGCTQVHAEDLMEGVEPREVEGTMVPSTFTESQMALAWKLFREVYDEEPNGNVLISPLSIQLALAMTANGASGQTRKEMEALLGGGKSMEELNEYLYSYVKRLSSEEACKLAIANSIWFRDDFQADREFLQTNADYYGSQIYKAKFDKRTLKDINRWVDIHTDGMIEEILQEIDPATVMYLINALAFDAEWKDIYTSDAIHDGSFTSISGEVQTVEMMGALENGYIVTENARGFVKDYQSGRYSFVALLPNEGVSLDAYIADLDATELKSALVDANGKSAFVYLPKFSYEYEIDLNDCLQELGMTTAFGGFADFSGMAEPSKELHIGNVTHKTYISVDERGTRAGAVTVVAMNNGCGMEPVETLYLDRPFLYMIIDHATYLPIFIGTLTDAS